MIYSKLVEPGSDCHVLFITLMDLFLQYDVMHCNTPAGIWHISGLIHSLNKNRRRIGDDLINATHKRLTAKGNTEDAAMVQDSQKLFPELIELAVLQLKERKLKWRMSVRMDLKRFLVPTLGALRARIPPPHQPSQRNTSLNTSHSTAGPSSTDYRVDTAYYGIDPNEVTNTIRLIAYLCSYVSLFSSYAHFYEVQWRFDQMYLFHCYANEWNYFLLPFNCLLFV